VCSDRRQKPLKTLPCTRSGHLENLRTHDVNLAVCASWKFWFVVCRVGVQQPTVEVRFQNLSVNAEVYVGTRALPTILNFYRNIVEVNFAF